MSQQINLHLPDDLVEQLRQIAEDMQRPFEAVAVAAIKQGVGSDLLFETSDEILDHCSDEELWAIVDQRLSKAEDRRYTNLHDKGKEGKLTPAEETELHSFVRKVNFQMLERTKALTRLQARGFDIKGGYLKTGKR